MVRLYNLIYSAAWARRSSQTDKNTSSVFNAEVIPARSCMKGKGGVRMVFWNAAVDEEFT